MAILLDENTSVLVQGITGREGSERTRFMRDYGRAVSIKQKIPEHVPVGPPKVVRDDQLWSMTFPDELMLLDMIEHLKHYVGSIEFRATDDLNEKRSEFYYNEKNAKHKCSYEPSGCIPIEKYLENILDQQENKTRMIELCHYMIKLCKVKSVELQKNS